MGAVRVWLHEFVCEGPGCSLCKGPGPGQRREQGHRGSGPLFRTSWSMWAVGCLLAGEHGWGHESQSQPVPVRAAGAPGDWQQGAMQGKILQEEGLGPRQCSGPRTGGGSGCDWPGQEGSCLWAVAEETEKLGKDSELV